MKIDTLHSLSSKVSQGMSETFRFDSDLKLKKRRLNFV
jgi:hypothetical protein